MISTSTDNFIIASGLGFQAVFGVFIFAVIVFVVFNSLPKK